MRLSEDVRAPTANVMHPRWAGGKEGNPRTVLLARTKQHVVVHHQRRDRYLSMKTIVLSHSSNWTTLSAQLVTSPSKDEITVLLVVARERESTRAVRASAGGIELVTNALSRSGMDIVMKEVKVNTTDFCQGVCDIFAGIKQTRPDDLVVDIPEDDALIGLEIFMAAALFASTVGPEKRERIIVLCEPDWSEERVNLFLPVWTVSRMVPLLRELREHPRSKLKDLRRALNRHPSTLSRQIRRVEQAGLMRKTEDGWQTTKFGEAVLECFSSPA